MAIEDITKGIAYPLRFAGIWIITIALIFISLLIGIIIFQKEKRKIFKIGSRTKLFIMIFSIITLLSFTAFTIAPESNITGAGFAIPLSILLMALYFIVTEEEGENTSLLDEIIEPYMIYCAIFLTINAVISGIYEANRIKKEYEYNYVLSNDINNKIQTESSLLILLGAVSDKYIFIDKSGFEHFIIDKSELPSLKFHHYNKRDSISVRHMKSILQGTKIN